MDQIMAMLGEINFAEILTKVTDFLAGIDFQAILDQIIAFVSGLIAA